MNELWLPVKDFEGYYEVSNTGFVRSVPRKTSFTHYGQITTVFHKGRVLKFHYDRGGYHRVTLVVSGIQYKFLVHRLVALSFLPNPDELPEVNHIDGFKANNTLSNLEWCTKEYNRNHATAMGLWSIKRTLSFSDQNKAIEMLKSGMTAWKISKIFNCNPSSIRTYGITGSKLNTSEKIK